MLVAWQQLQLNRLIANLSPAVMEHKVPGVAGASACKQGKLIIMMDVASVVVAECRFMDRRIQVVLLKLTLRRRR